MRGISAETARVITGDLGHELLSQLTTRGALANRSGRIAEIDAGTTQVNSATRPGDMRKQIAKQVTGSIKRSVK
jgi:hypothetical protein